MRSEKEIRERRIESHTSAFIDANAAILTQEWYLRWEFCSRSSNSWAQFQNETKILSVKFRSSSRSISPSQLSLEMSSMSYISKRLGRNVPKLKKNESHHSSSRSLWKTISVHSDWWNSHSGLHRIWQVEMTFFRIWTARFRKLLLYYLFWGSW